MSDSHTAARVVFVAGLGLDRVSRELLASDGAVRLQEKPFLVLEALMERPGEVVTREALRHLLWPDGTVVDFDNNLNSAVATVRAALRNLADAPSAIETLPRVGYRFVAPVTSAPPVDPAVAQRPGYRWRTVAAVAGIGFALVATVVGLTQRTSQHLAAAAALRPAATASRATHPDAQQAWQRGLYLRERGNPDDLEQALAAFDVVTRLEPDLANAHAQRADALVRLSFVGRRDIRDGMGEARQAAVRALALDPTNATAYRVQATASLHLDWDLAAAATAIDRALDLDPDDPDTRLAAATWFVATGRHDAAVIAARRAVELDPASHLVRADLGWFLLAARRYDEAIEACDQALAVDADFTPALLFKVDAFVGLGRDERAVAAAQQFMHAAGVEPEVIVATLNGAPGAALDAFRRWQLKRAEQAPASHLGLAMRHAAVGDDDAALRHLDQAYAEREPMLIYLRGYRVFDGLRADPRLERLAARFSAPETTAPGDGRRI